MVVFFGYMDGFLGKPGVSIFLVVALGLRWKDCIILLFVFALLRLLLLFVELEMVLSVSHTLWGCRYCLLWSPWSW